MCFTFSQTLIGGLLDDFEVQNEETGENLVQAYVVDFLHMSYKGVHFHPNDIEIEYNVSLWLESHITVAKRI